MAATGLSGKRALISQANSTVVLVTSIAAFVFVFSLVASKTLFSQAGYQNRLIGAEHTAVTQLGSDITAARALDSSYNMFVNTPQNVIGGNPTGSGAQDGDNAKIVLDALPSSYDFPAMVTSLQQMLGTQAVTVNSITGTDEEASQGSVQSSNSPQPVAMPFEISVTGNYTAIQGVVSEFEHSIRPIQVQKMSLSGNQATLTLDLTAQTFYQPAKTFNISQEVVQ